MLIYKNKIYVKPVEYKLVEVKVDKQGEGFDIKPIGKLMEITAEELKETREISVQEAYEHQHKSTKSQLKKLLDQE